MKQYEIKAVFFDLGNVLVLFDPDIVEKGLSEYGKIPPGGMSGYIMESDNMNKYMEGKITSSQFYTRTKKFFKLRIGYTDFYRIWNSMFYPYPEMEKSVLSLKKKYPGVKLVLVSNTNEAHFEFIMKEYDVLGHFDHLIASHEIGRQKPHPDIFNAALKVAEVLPKEVFYTDDRPDLIEKARVLGIRAFLFEGYEKFRKQLSRVGGLEV